MTQNGPDSLYFIISFIVHLCNSNLWVIFTKHFAGVSIFKKLQCQISCPVDGLTPEHRHGVCTKWAGFQRYWFFNLEYVLKYCPPWEACKKILNHSDTTFVNVALTVVHQNLDSITYRISRFPLSGQFSASPHCDNIWYVSVYISCLMGK